MQASSLTASGWNNPPLGQGQNVTPCIYQNGGGVNGILCTHVGQHHSGLHTGPASQLLGNVENGGNWNHQMPQVPTAPSSVTQANSMGTASSLPSRNQYMFDRRGPCTTLSNNGVQWRPSSWNGSVVPNLTKSSVAAQNDALHPVAQKPAFHHFTHRPLERGIEGRQGSANSLALYPTKQAVGKTYAKRAPKTHFEVVCNGLRNGPISTEVGSAMTQCANLNYPVADTNSRSKGPHVVQEVIRTQEQSNCGQEASPVLEAATWGHGQGTSAVVSSVVQSSNANYQPSSLDGFSVTSRMNTQGSQSNGSATAVNFVSAFENRLEVLLRKMYGDEHGKSSTVPVGARETIQKILTTPNLPPLTIQNSLNPNSSFTNGNSDSNCICYSSSKHVQPSSGPYEPHPNLPSNSRGGIVHPSTTFTQQQSGTFPAVCLPPPAAPQQQRSISNNSQGSGVWCGNVPHFYQNQELPRETLYQNRARESSALSRVNGQARQGITNIEPNHSFGTTTNAPSTSAADPRTLKSSHSWPSNQVAQSCGQLQNGKNPISLAHQQTKEYRLSVVEDRQRNHFTAQNKLPPSYTLTMARKQMLIGKTTEVDSGKSSVRCNSSADRSRCLDTDTSATAQQLECQQNVSMALVGMKAIAVVPPISQHSNTDQAAAITDKCKIQTTSSDESVGGNPENESNNPCLSNVKESTPTVSSSDKSLCNVMSEVSTTVGETQQSLQPPTALPETSVSVGSNPPQPNANEDEELVTKEDAFDLSTVPVIFWTVDKLKELIATLEDVSPPSEPNVEEGPTHHIVRIFWDGSMQNLYSALDANVEETIFDTWRTCTDDENPVIFSEINSTCNVKLAEKCLILGPDDYISNDPVCKPLSLNLCERTDNVDKCQVNPKGLGMHITERDNQRMKPDEMEKCKVEEPVTDTLDNELPQKQPQTEMSGPLVEVSDPLSMLEIKVLSPTEARELCNQLFGSQPSESDTVEDPETKGPKGSHDNKDVVKSYCCLSRWMEITIGYEASSLCKCKLDSSQEQQEVYKEIKKDERLSTATYLEERCFPPAEPNCRLVPQTKLMASESSNEFDVMSNECAATSDVIQNPLDSNVDMHAVTKESLSECEKGDNLKEEGPAEHAVEGSILELKTKMSAPVDCDLKIEHVYSSFKEVITAAVTSEQLSKRLSEEKPCGSDSSKTDAKDVAFGKVGVESTDEGMQLVDLQGMLTGTVSHSLRQRFHSRKKKKLMSGKKLKESKSKLPFQKLSPQNLKSFQKTPNSLPITGIEMNLDCSCDNQQKTLNGTTKHPKDSLNAPKLPFSTCSTNEQVSDNKAKILRTETFQKVSVPSEGSFASLALYGSSAQKQKYIVFSSRQPDLKPCTSTTTGPPTTISLKLNSPKRNLLGEDPGTAARQRVYSSWERSFFRQRSDFNSKVMPTKSSRVKGSQKSGNGDTRRPKGSSKIAKVEEEASCTSSRVSSKKKNSVTPKKCEKYGKNASRSCTETKGKAVRTTEPDASKCGMVQNKRRLSKKDEQLLCLNGKKRKTPPKGGPVQASKKPCKSISCDSVGKSKYEIGNPALKPALVKEKFLDFKLLPASFKFREPQDTKVKNHYEELTGREHARTIKPATWKMKCLWRYSPKRKDPAVPAPSQRVIQSHTTYEEYKKRYLAKTAK